MKSKVDYDAIYKFLGTTRMKIIDAAIIAWGINVDRIYGATMFKLVRDGALEPMPRKGCYRNLLYSNSKEERKNSSGKI